SAVLSPLHLPIVFFLRVFKLLRADSQNRRLRIHDRDYLLLSRLHHERRRAGRRASGNQERGDLLLAHHSRGCTVDQVHLFHISGECPMIDRPTPAVVFDHVSKSFGTKQVLRDVSFDVGPGEGLCILGRSGTGKSVTLKLIVSLLKPDQGKIWVEQDEITRLRESELSRVRRKMGFLFQDAALFDSLTLYENLTLPLFRLTKKSPQEVDFIVDRVLRQVGLACDKSKMPAELSGGMRKRAGLARALVLEPKI